MQSVNYEDNVCHHCIPSIVISVCDLTPVCGVWMLLVHMGGFRMHTALLGIIHFVQSV